MPFDITLPETFTLAMPFAAFLYPTPDNARGVTLSGNGQMTLSFGAIEDGQCDVAITDIEARVNPCRIPFDLTGDGTMDCIEVPYMKVGSDLFDLKASVGRFTPETGALVLKMVVELDKALLGETGRALGKSLRIEMEEHGFLDLETGRLDTKSQPFTVPDGPLKGLTVVNCSPGEISCWATVAFGVAVNAAGASLPPAGSAQTTINIARNSPVSLLWDAVHTKHLVISPDVGRKGPKGAQAIPDIAAGLRAIDRSAIYECKTTGVETCVGTTKYVHINVLERGDVIEQTADFDDNYGFWRATLPPHTYDPAILVGEILFDSHHAKSIRFQRWRLDHIPQGSGSPSGSVISSLDDWKPLATSQTLPGEYRFMPVLNGAQLPSPEYARTIFFSLRVVAP